MALYLLVLILLPLLQEVTSQRTKCNPVPLGMADKRITDAMITVSSEEPGKGKTKGRYGCCEDKFMEAWCPRSDDKHPFYEVHLNKPEAIEGLKFQHPSLGQSATKYPDAFIKNFSLLFRSSFSESGELQEFNHDIPAIYNESTSYHVSFIPLFVTDVIRIEARSWQQSPCFRMEIMSCRPEDLCPVSYCQHNGSCVGPNTCKCVGSYFGDRCHIEKSAVVVTTYMFLRIESHIVITTSYNLTLHGNVHIQTQETHKILILERNSYVEVQHVDKCLSNLDACSSGFTFSLTASFTHLTSEACHLVSSGGDRPAHKGIALIYHQKQLLCYVSTATQKWVLRVPFVIKSHQWYKFQISWHVNLGLQLYEGDKLIGSVLQAVPTVCSKTQPLLIGYTTNTATLAVHKIQTVPLIHSESIRAGIHQDTLPPPLNEETTTVKPTTLKLTTLKPTTLKPTTLKPTTLKLTTLKPTAEETTTPTTTIQTTVVPTTTVLTTLATTTEVETTTAKPCNGTPIKDNQFSIDLSFINITHGLAFTKHMTIDVFGNPTLFKKDNVTYLNMTASGQYLQIDPNCLPCFADLQNCTRGFTIQIDVQFTFIVEGNKTYIIHSGTDSPLQSGISLYYQNERLKIVVQAGHDKWIANIPYTLTPKQTYMFYISWGQTFGLKVYVNRYLIHEIGSLHLDTLNAVHAFPIAVGKGVDSPDTSSITITNFHIWMSTINILIEKEIIEDPLTTPAPTTTTTPAPTVPYSHREYHFNLKAITTPMISSHGLTMHIHGKPNTDKDGIHFSTSEHYLQISQINNTCLTDLRTCTHGITVAIEVQFTKLEENTVVFTTGGEAPDMPGLAMVYRFGQLHVVCSTISRAWYVTLSTEHINVTASNVFHISWSSSTTLKVYANKVLLATAHETAEHKDTSTQLQGSFYFSKAVSVSSWKPVHGVLKQLDIWFASIDILVHRGQLTVEEKNPDTSTPVPGVCPAGCISEKDVTKATEKPTTPEKTTITKVTTYPPTTAKQPTTSKPTTPLPTTTVTTSTAPTTQKPTIPKPTPPKPIGIPPFEVVVTIRPDVVGTEAFFVCGVTGLTVTKDVIIKFTWHIEGTQSSYEKQVTLPTTDASLAVSSIDADLHNKQVNCTAQAKYITGTEWTDVRQSLIFTPSIQLVTDTRIKIQVIEGQIGKTIGLKANCPPQMLCGKNDKGKCKVQIIATVSSRGDHRCTHSIVMPQVVLGSKVTGSENHICGSHLTSANWKQTIQIPVKATVDGLYDRNTMRTITIKLEVTGEITQQTLVTDLTHSRPYQVHIINRDVKSTCACVNDPHITTFDGLHYNNYLSGEYVLYKHKTLPYEVRAHFSKCSNHRRNGATCNIGVAIRSGDDVITLKGAGGVVTSSHRHRGFFFGMFRHHRRPHRSVSAITMEMYKNGELTPGTTIRRIGCGQKYEIRLPTGTVVTVQASHSPFINIWVRASAVDYGQTLGLCGQFDGNRRNDLLGSNHITYRFSSFPNGFSNTWQVPLTMFYGVRASSVENTVVSEVYCNCAEGTRVPYCAQRLDIFQCSTTVSRDDVTKMMVQQAKRPVVTSHRTKRAAESVTQTTVETQTDPPPAFTEQEANTICLNYIMNSTAVSHCMDVLNVTQFNDSIHDCADDLVGTGVKEFARAHVENIIEQCVSEAARDVSKWQGDNSTIMSNQIPKSIISNLCIDDCGINGNCTSGVCICHDGYTGDICDVSRAVPPQVIPINPNGDTCDVSNSDCSQVALFGFDFVESNALTCHYEYIQVDDAVRLTGESGEVKAEYISMYQVNCHLPRSTSAFISVSNDGHNKSESQYLHVARDSKCFNCDILEDGKQAKCSRQADTCMIGSQCFQVGQTRESDKCQICDPVKDETKWVRSADPLCNAQKLEDGAINTTTIALAAVCAVLATVLLVGAVVMYRRRKAKNTEKMSDTYSLEKTSSFSGKAMAFHNDIVKHNNTEPF